MPQLNQLADVANSQFFWLLLVLAGLFVVRFAWLAGG